MARPWSPKTEYPVFDRLAGEGAEAIAAELGRSVHSVKAKAKRLGKSLRRRGERRGLVIGQPRTVSLTSDTRGREVRELVVTRRIDMTVVLERMTLRVRGEAELCPRCVVRPVAPNSRFGLCAVCHKKELVDNLNDELALLEAKKEQQVAWQRIHRVKEQLEQVRQ